MSTSEDPTNGDLGFVVNKSLMELVLILETFNENVYIEGSSYSSINALIEEHLRGESWLTEEEYQALRSVKEKFDNFRFNASFPLRIAQDLANGPDDDEDEDVYTETAIIAHDKATDLIQAWEVMEMNLKWLWSLLEHGGPDHMERFLKDARKRVMPLLIHAV